MNRESLEQRRERFRSLEVQIQSGNSDYDALLSSSLESCPFDLAVTSALMTHLPAAAAEKVSFLLGNNDPLVRNAAAFALKSSLEMIGSLLAAEESSTKSTALVGVLLCYYHGRVADHDSQLKIFNCLNHPSSGVADWAEWVLARVGLPPECLQVSEVIRQPRILSILARTGPHSRIGVSIVAIIAQSIPILLAPAVNALSYMGIDADLTLDLLRRIPADDPSLQFDGIRLVSNAMGGHRMQSDAPPSDAQVEEMLAFVADRLNHENQWVRYRAVLFFCDFRQFVPDRSEAIAERLSDCNPAVRWRASDALSSAQLERKHKDVVVSLLKHDPNTDVGLAVAKLTYSFPEPSSLWQPELEELLESALFPQNLRGILVAGWIGDQSCVERLIRLSASPAAEIRGWVAWALARVPEFYDRRYDALTKLCRDDCWQVRMTALQGLVEHFALTNSVQEILFTALADSDEQVRETACKLISRIPLSELNFRPEILHQLDSKSSDFLGPSRNVLSRIRSKIKFVAPPS